MYIYIYVSLFSPIRYPVRMIVAGILRPISYLGPDIEAPGPSSSRGFSARNQQHHPKAGACQAIDFTRRELSGLICHQRKAASILSGREKEQKEAERQRHIIHLHCRCSFSGHRCASQRLLGTCAAKAGATRATHGNLASAPALNTTYCLHLVGFWPP